MQVQGKSWFDSRSQFISNKQDGSGLHRQQGTVGRKRERGKALGERGRSRVDLPSLRQVAPSYDSLVAISYLGFCTTKEDDGWIIRNSRSYSRVVGLDPYDNPQVAQEIADHLNTLLKEKEIELLR